MADTVRDLPVEETLYRSVLGKIIKLKHGAKRPPRTEMCNWIYDLAAQFTHCTTASARPVVMILLNKCQIDP